MHVHVHVHVGDVCVCVQVFDTVMELVEYHKVEPLHLKSGGKTTLKFECPRRLESEYNILCRHH